jgi:hypothetical protein
MYVTTLAAWGKFLGGVAVVVSLIYLASQIQQNSKLLKASTASATSATNADFSGLIVRDAEVARILREGMAYRASLPENDMSRFDALLGLAFTAQNQEYQFFAVGEMVDAVRENRFRSMRRFLRMPGHRQRWTERGDPYSDDFRDVVDGLVREGQVTG